MFSCCGAVLWNHFVLICPLSFSKQFVFGSVSMRLCCIVCDLILEFYIRFVCHWRRFMHSAAASAAAAIVCISQCRLTARVAVLIRAHHKQQQCGQSIVFISQFHIIVFVLFCHLSLSPVPNCSACLFSFIERSSWILNDSHSPHTQNAYFVQLKSHELFFFLSPASLYLCLLLPWRVQRPH